MTVHADKIPSLQPGITVVIPVYNRAGIVGATLQSVARQTYRPMRVVLVDNNSTDATLNVLRRWASEVEAPDFNVEVVVETHHTAAAARRKGSELVSTEYVMFFDSDDIMHPAHVERAMRAFESDSDLDIVGWDFPLVNSVGRKLRMCRFYKKNLIWHGLMNGSMSTQRYAMRTALLHQAGGWNPAIRAWNDMELGIRLALLHPKVLKLKGEAAIEVICHPNSITGISFSADTAKWECALDAIDAELPTRRYRRMSLLKRAVLAGYYRKEGAISDSQRLMSIIYKRENCPFYRFLFRTAMLWQANGLPGVSLIFRPFF